MARKHFVASFYSNCDGCENVIEPGDDAYFVTGFDRAVCEDCLDEIGDDEPDHAPEPSNWDELR